MLSSFWPKTGHITLATPTLAGLSSVGTLFVQTSYKILDMLQKERNWKCSKGKTRLVYSRWTGKQQSQEGLFSKRLKTENF